MDRAPSTPVPVLDDNSEDVLIGIKKPQTSRIYGHIPGIKHGDTWNSRIACLRAKVHQATWAGIHGCSEGAYSIVLSGGYDDDVDNGETIIYTGAGGRDSVLKRQVCHQDPLSTLNYSLFKSYENKKPVRVVRGSQLDSKYAPEAKYSRFAPRESETVYRYDGLYTVEDCALKKGQDGFLVCTFVLQRCGGQPPLPVQGQSRVNQDAMARLPTPPISVHNDGVQVSTTTQSIKERQEKIRQLKEEYFELCKAEHHNQIMTPAAEGDQGDIEVIDLTGENNRDEGDEEDRDDDDNW